MLCKNSDQKQIENLQFKFHSVLTVMVLLAVLLSFLGHQKCIHKMKAFSICKQQK